jgi:hypothetical protein
MTNIAASKEKTTTNDELLKFLKFQNENTVKEQNGEWGMSVKMAIWMTWTSATIVDQKEQVYLNSIFKRYISECTLIFMTNLKFKWKYETKSTILMEINAKTIKTNPW